MSMTDKQKKVMDAMNDPDMLKYFEHAINNPKQMNEIINKGKIIHKHVGIDLCSCDSCGDLEAYHELRFDDSLEIADMCPNCLRQLQKELNQLWPQDGI